MNNSTLHQYYQYTEEEKRNMEGTISHVREYLSDEGIPTTSHQEIYSLILEIVAGNDDIHPVGATTHHMIEDVFEEGAGVSLYSIFN